MLYLTDFVCTALSEAVTRIMSTLQIRKLGHEKLHGLPMVTQIISKEESTPGKAQAPHCTSERLSDLGWSTSIFFSVENVDSCSYT